jgi:hypothetical protein
MIAGSISLFVCTAPRAAGTGTTGREPAVQNKESKETWVTEFKKELDDLDKKADALAAKARRNVAEQKKEFKKDHQAAEKKLDSLKADASRKWEEVKPELEAALKDVKKAFEKLRSSSEDDSK